MCLTTALLFFVGFLFGDSSSVAFLNPTSSAAVPTCIWMSFSASHRISSAVHDIGTDLDVL